jgi:hypothetical protein
MRSNIYIFIIYFYNIFIYYVTFFIKKILHYFMKLLKDTLGKLKHKRKVEENSLSVDEGFQYKTIIYI